YKGCSCGFADPKLPKAKRPFCDICWEAYQQDHTEGMMNLSYLALKKGDKVYPGSAEQIEEFLRMFQTDPQEDCMKEFLKEPVSKQIKLDLYFKELIGRSLDSGKVHQGRYIRAFGSGRLHQYLCRGVRVNEPYPNGLTYRSSRLSPTS